MKDMHILAIIPARGGSKGIPRKNVRLLNNQPLISYAIQNAQNSNYITDVYISTDDVEIETVAHKYNCEVIKRDPKLALDNITLDPVIYDAVLKAEKMQGLTYDIVVTMQPTSPVLRATTLDAALAHFIANDVDTLISVVNKPHLAWKEENGQIVPNYTKRLNRQELPANYLETGAFVITKREFVKENTRFGAKIGVYEISEDEAVDIDSYLDWALCENILKKKKIFLRCNGYKKIGMGHIYHCLTLAYHLTGHDVTFILNEEYEDGINKIKESYFPYRLIKNDADFYQLIETEQPDIIVNDCLDTTAEYIKNLKKRCPKVVTIEDLGTGAAEANVCINALYENNHGLSHVYGGEKYICLREEFLISTPITVKKDVQNIIVMFGGTDPSNLTRKIYDLALQSDGKIQFTFVTGIGYDAIANGIISNEEKNIVVLNNVKNICNYMEKADIAITSQGRTVYELATVGLPAIVLAQNERELLHTFAKAENGFINLGLGKDVNCDTIKKTINDLVADYDQRVDMHEKMLAKDLKSGVNREINLILE